ncbi:hypothetical protein [Marinobacter sp. LV10R510-11A]|uniref:DUF968 domain-containing protein n=1 Tax=Marinobacter sp. LV10R510-11A TaxID=1415568 RepID=UPI001D0D6899|nr:hypothetical protein [Marinobacter sp. LV10R510-11A]
MKKRSSRKPRAGDNRNYLDWVKTQPCAMCQRPADDPHHIIGVGLGGMGMTAPDLLAMPLCREHHNEIHISPELWPQQFEWVVRTIARAVSEGAV